MILDKAREIWRNGRTAKPASVRFNYAKTLAQTAAMWTVFLGVGPFLAWQIETLLAVSRFEFPKFLAAILFFGGAALAFSSQYFLVTRGDGTPLPLDSTRRFVVEGPYRYVRNPMALGSLLQGYALGFWLGSPLVLLYVYAGTLAWNYLARPWEERDLERKFGAPFLRYKGAVRCWIPRFSPYDSSRP